MKFEHRHISIRTGSLMELLFIDNNLCDRRSVSRLPLMFEECE